MELHTTLITLLVAVAALLLGLLAGVVLWLRERASLSGKIATLASERDVALAKLDALVSDESRSQAAFAQLAGLALHQNSEQLANRARADLQGLLLPLKENLGLLEKQVHEIERDRKQAYGSLDARLLGLGEAQQQLHHAATGLKEALHSSKARGRWGEIQLKRIVELSGMQEHVDFQEQFTAGEGRPDLIVHLGNGGVLPVDAKVPFDAYAAATDEPNEELRTAKYRQHALAMRARVRELALRKYWDQFEQAPEFVVMFVPGEPILAAAFEHDAALLDDAMEQKVLICSPVNLLALLKAVAYGWQQQTTYQNSREIADAGRELYDRLETFLKHLSGIGTRLDSAVDTYNKALGSLERSVMPSVRRLRELGIAEKDPESPAEIERRPRLSAGPALPDPPATS